jgi:hypothetical protein
MTSVAAGRAKIRRWDAGLPEVDHRRADLADGVSCGAPVPDR